MTQLQKLLERLKNIDLLSISQEEAFIIKNNIASVEYIISKGDDAWATDKLLQGLELVCNLYEVKDGR